MELAARSVDTEVRRLNLERQRLELQLQTLKSQIEPHFLFNTLATIRRLHESDPPRGRATLADFIRYLRATVPELRGHRTTLGKEIELVTAYLDVLSSRMEEHLRVSIDVPPELRDHAIPPLSVASLVENAIKHGINKISDSGAVTISASIVNDRLVVRVADTGPGFVSAEGTGTGLANLRSRLDALYGEMGSVSLAPNSPRGVIASLSVPAGINAQP
jgi:LytS/YehU family sensor histidine kinase